MKLVAGSGAAAVGGVSLSGAVAAVSNEIDRNSDNISGAGYDIDTSIGVAGSTTSETGQVYVDGSWTVDIKQNDGQIQLLPRMYAVPIYDTDNAYVTLDIPYFLGGGDGSVDQLAEAALEVSLDALGIPFSDDLIPEQDDTIDASNVNKGFELDYPDPIEKYNTTEYTGGASMELNSQVNDVVKTYQVYTIIDVIWTPTPSGPRADDNYEYTFGTSVNFDVQF